MSIQRGQIYFVTLDPVQGHEQSGQRPVLVLSVNTINQQPLVITVVIGTKGAKVPHDYPTNVRVDTADSGLPMETVFLCFQIRALDQSRFPTTPAGKISDTALRKVEKAVRYCLGL
ncbi:MAG: type II toxin-antitoxin system PemK/MazF family toxin [Aggregatilineales bacterium]